MARIISNPRRPWRDNAPPDSALRAAQADTAVARATPQPPAATTIADELRRAIVHCELTPGDRLSEVEVSQRFGVSRQPVREAFIRLSVAGLVEVRAKSGTRVLPVDVDVIRTARFVREAFEVEVAREIVARGLTKATRHQLDDIIAAQEACDDRSRFLDLDEDFHRALADAAGASAAWPMIDSVKAQMDRVRYLSMAELHCRRLVKQHRKIVSTISARDEAGAVAATRKHLTEILRSLTVVAERYPAIFAGHQGRPLERLQETHGRSD
ncbi:MAG: GntR family transcriptional regulator [Pseudomonadota bacterium]